MTFMKRLFQTSAVTKDISALKEAISTQVASSEVVIYSKTYCPYCTTAKNLISSNFSSASSEVYELDKMEDGSAIQGALAEMTGQRTVPSVWIKGKHVGGCDDTVSLFRSGQLAQMLS